MTLCICLFVSPVLGAVGLFCVFPSPRRVVLFCFFPSLFSFYLLLGQSGDFQALYMQNICSTFWKIGTCFFKNKKIGSRYWDEVRSAKDLSVMPVKWKGAKVGLCNHSSQNEADLTKSLSAPLSPMGAGEQGLPTRRGLNRTGMAGPLYQSLVQSLWVPSWEDCDLLREVL